MARYCAGFVFGISLDIHYPNLVGVALLICIAVLIVAVVRRAMGAA
jgi:cell shape-determining protein MreD